MHWKTATGRTRVCPLVFLLSCERYQQSADTGQSVEEPLAASQWFSVTSDKSTSANGQKYMKATQAARLPTLKVVDPPGWRSHVNALL
jgi:hypothetical protein